MLLPRGVMVVVLVASLAGCAPGEPGDARASAAPALGAADGGDEADRDCRVVLRELRRAPGPGGYAVECIEGGACWYVWEGVVDVAERSVAVGDTPSVLYRAGSDDTWWSVEAEPVDFGPPGYQRFRIRFYEHTVGPGMSLSSLMRTRIEVAPYLRTAAGGRVFDHNRNPGDFDDYVLDAGNEWSVGVDGSVCAYTVEPPSVRLLTAQIATGFAYPMTMLTTLRGLVRVTGSGYADSVTVHYRVSEGHAVSRDWTTVAARPIYGGLWEFETPVFEGVCPHYCPRHVFQFAFEYELDGVVLWDNNGGPGVDYRLANDIGSSVPGDWPGPAILDQPVRLTDVSWEAEYAALGGQVLVRNLSYQKQVDIVYTTDAWQTVREAPARFDRLTRDDQEYWRFQLDLPDHGDELRFAIRYRTGGATYWDNYVGFDYVVPTPAP